MKTLTRILTLSATFVALIGSARAQLATYEQQYETQTGYFGSSLTFSTFGGSMAQTFSNVSAVSSMTYNFFNGTSSGPTSAATLTATFGEWNGSGFVTGTTVDFGTISIPASNSGLWSSSLSITGGSYANYSVTLDLTSLTSNLINSTYGYLTSSTKTYALLLTDSTAATDNLALGGNFSNNFTYGAAYPIGGSADWVFSQIVVVPDTIQLVPTPEAGTVASIAAAVLVAGLTSFRLRQRRQLALAPVAAA